MQVLSPWCFSQHCTISSHAGLFYQITYWVSIVWLPPRPYCATAATSIKPRSPRQKGKPQPSVGGTTERGLWLGGKTGVLGQRGRERDGRKEGDGMMLLDRVYQVGSTPKKETTAEAAQKYPTTGVGLLKLLTRALPQKRLSTLL